MNTLQVSETPVALPPEKDINDFKQKVSQWLRIDDEVSKHEQQIKELKKLRLQLEPEITGFMRQFNIVDLNTDHGKIRCATRNVKQSINKSNIRDNLSKIIQDETHLDQAVTLIYANRDVKTIYSLKMSRT
tara:strand:+ start:218 stop:610 length:393 start_codon:yes stop_codon:yes gene_type:complete